jgi:putative membrane protein
VPPRRVDTEAPDGGRFDEAGDATRRTHLANERTSMAWWRTGLTSVAVSLGIGKLIPDVGTTEHRWPYAAIGFAYALIGVVLMAYGTWRHRTVDQAIMRGAFVRPAPAFLWAVTGLGAVLGVLTAILIVVHP